jgi:hypothetical protein
MYQVDGLLGQLQCRIDGHGTMYLFVVIHDSSC